jgi:hypothetical protein
MDLDSSQYSEADRREVDPPIQVETATWSKAGQLDWWVKERHEWWVAYAVQTAVNGGSKPLIFVPQAAHSHDLSDGNSAELPQVRDNLVDVSSASPNGKDPVRWHERERAGSTGPSTTGVRRSRRRAVLDSQPSWD